MSPPNGLRFLFAGTPEFAAIPLQGLLDAGYRPSAVLTQPDRPAGRGRRLQSSPVKQVAMEAGLKVMQPSTLSEPEVQQQLQGLRPELMIVVAYGLILPAQVLEIPSMGCWNIHASLLPRWRGAAPIQRAIEAGDEQTGVCIMQMDQGLDTGPVLLRKAIPLHGSETAGELHDQLAALGATALLESLHLLSTGSLPPAVAQDDSKANYAAKLNKSEAQLDWNQSAALLERQVRAFSPWPAAWCIINDEVTRVWKSRVVEPPDGAQPGDVLQASANGIDIATGAGALRILELQPAGKRRMSVADYLNSRQLPPSLASRT